MCVCTAVCGDHKLQDLLTGRCAAPALRSVLGSSPCPHLLRYMHSDGVTFRASAVSLQAVLVRSLHFQVGSLCVGQAFCL